MKNKFEDPHIRQDFLKRLAESQELNPYDFAEFVEFTRQNPDSDLVNSLLGAFAESEGRDLAELREELLADSEFEWPADDEKGPENE